MKIKELLENKKSKIDSSLVVYVNPKAVAHDAARPSVLDTVKL